MFSMAIEWTAQRDYRLKKIPYRPENGSKPDRFVQVYGRASAREMDELRLLHGLTFALAARHIDKRLLKIGLVLDR